MKFQTYIVFRENEVAAYWNIFTDRKSEKSHTKKEVDNLFIKKNKNNCQVLLEKVKKKRERTN